MRLSTVVWAAVCLSLLCQLVSVHARKGKKSRKGGKGKKITSGTWSCVDKTTFNMTAEEMKKSFRVKCGRGKLITGLSVVGHNDSCQGLTPSMFVQMASCHWKNMCKLHYSTKAINFMIKVFNNSNSFLCVLKTPDFFTISYQCSKKKGQPYDVWWIGEDQIVEDKKGILRSHSDHPWLYRRGHDLDFKEKVTVRRPQKDKRLKILQYTIRSLNLMSGDNLTVTWYTTQKQVKTFQGNVQLSDNVRKRTFHIKDSVGEVKFALKTSLHTTGGDGFVICFKWTKTANRKDTCRSLIAPKKCVS